MTTPGMSSEKRTDDSLSLPDSIYRTTPHRGALAVLGRRAISYQSFSQKVQGESSPMRAAPVLKEVNGLPGGEGKPSFDQGNRQLDLGECRAKMCRPMH